MYFASSQQLIYKTMSNSRKRQKNYKLLNKKRNTAYGESAVHTCDYK